MKKNNLSSSIFPLSSSLILVTGGAGYIGSHTLIELEKAGFDFVVLDNLSNSSKEAIKRVSKIINKDIKFIEGDIRDKKKLKDVFNKFQIDGVIHFAALKAVGESVSKPLEYYENNVCGSINLLEVMKEFNIKKFVFSSSATVYGEPEKIPVTEDMKTGQGITNPYGRSKYMIEEILKDLFISDNSWKIAILRYFNPIGAHESGMIGEDPNGIPNNLMPFISQVAVGKLSKLKVFGGDYPTRDGTGVRDYIHVMDLANAHVKALEYLNKNKLKEPLIVNLGRGEGYSVLEMVKAFEEISGVKIPYEIVERREGDIAEIYADPTKAKELINWKAKRGIKKMCEDTWRWQKNNPDGYGRANE